MYDLLHRTRPQGASLEELNRALGWKAWSYINDTTGIAKMYGGKPHWNRSGPTRRFWITQD
ncbi:hypothetical protein EN850_12355 [Mesorhizobium sp. M8A.F.Ca.ET.207.01.1.1]|nr:hypothetical protein EN850_12355 [Mesorhizobium sp. M8A.F.Ca.ET.207.01.1.1]